MTDTIDVTATGDEVLDELRSWLADNWDPDLSVADWWERLGLAGWAAPTLPTNAYGRGVARSIAVQIGNEINAFGALGPPAGLGLLLAAPTIADHGTQEQIDTYVRDIVTGQRAWCQLFSEPGAGSDLAGLTTRAVQDGDEWIVDGQKVWTSLGQTADLGMLIARTNPEAPKHQGITYFAIDMHQPGVEVRPLRELTGHAMFNETFLTEARVPDSAIIGDRNNGWAVANSTLGHERSGLGAGGGSGGAGACTPGTIAGNLGLRAGDFAPKAAPRNATGAAAGDAEAAKKRRSGASGMGGLFVGLAKGNGTITDPVIRQGLAQLHTLTEIGRFNAERLKATRSQGGDIKGMANIAKLGMSNIVRLQRDLGLAIVGPQGMLHAYEPAEQKALDEATGNPFLAAVTMTALYAQAPPIYGGTDQIQRNIIGERVLGLPKEPGNDKNVPFSELPKNA
ncbi:MAG: putative acyl-CoA dehydrogenase [Acidimicrobiales bacterium]|nr:putative acyl-CoA dehydrogenase [Acidimicrobiales bacterium]